MKERELSMGDQLKKISSQVRINSLFSRLRDSDESVFIWKFVGDKKIVSRIKIVLFKKIKKDFSIKPFNEDEEHNFNLILGGSEEVNFFSSQDLVMFRCNLIRFNDSIYEFRLPLFVAQAERRKFVRLPCYMNDSIYVKFSKCCLFPKFQIQHFHKSCFDISPGGISIVVSRIESKLFHPQDKIEEMNLFVGGKEIKIDARVVAVREVTPGESEDLWYKVVRINLMITKISKIDYDFLHQFVFANFGNGKQAV